MGSEIIKGIGVDPYHHPEPAVYRVLVGAGVNIPRFSTTPVTEFAIASFRQGTGLFSAALMDHRSTGGSPQRTLTEFDLMYGYAYEREFASQSSPPTFCHIALSTGVALDTYSVRWRRNRRAAGDFLSAQPNTFEYAAGLPVQLEVIFEPLKLVGIGLLGYLNLNQFSADYGVALGLEARY